MWALIENKSSTSWIASIEYYFCESTAQQEMKTQDIEEDQPYCRAQGARLPASINELIRYHKIHRNFG